MSRRVFYWEEPIWHSQHEAWNAVDIDLNLNNSRISVDVIKEESSLWVIQPHLTVGADLEAAQVLLVDAFLAKHSVENFDRWYYTPMALGFTAHLRSAITVYDCMDELTGFLGAPPKLRERELELFELADVVFTGGISLYEEKRKQHRNVHPFPSSIDRQHFDTTRTPCSAEPEDQSFIPHPRAGFYGVVDERFDARLLAEIALLRPHIHFIILGPVVKIDATSLPVAENIHYLGPKTYSELPAYLSGWDIALLLFAMNDATRFISPTKTPEYLAAGKQVVSTPIRDVVRAYGDAGLVAIADTPEAFATALDNALRPASSDWKIAVQAALASNSWDTTWAAMQLQLDQCQTLRSDKAGTLHLAKESSNDLMLQASAKQIAYQPHVSSFPPRSTPRSTLRTERYDYLVVGAGFAGSVMAERLASQAGKRVLIIDKRDHIAGNAYDHYNEDGILIHRYGPHIFHTNSESVFQYLSQFTEWRPYEHRVLSSVSNQLLPVPINLDTINKLYGLGLDAEGMRSFLSDRVITKDVLRTSEDIVLSRVGRELYELFFRNYTRKQWGLDPSELDACVAGRIPVRYDRDDRYFSDLFQAMPLHGYTRMFEKMLDSPNITVRTGTDYSDVIRVYPKIKIIYTGPIDEYFGFCFGPLPYRSLDFRHETIDRPVYQSAAVVNFPNDHDYTRITEFKHLTGQQHKKTSIVFEYPRANGDPYYPIPRPENAALFEKYRELAKLEEQVHFCGRLANYRYFNMDQVVAQALTTYSHLFEAEAAGLYTSNKSKMPPLTLKPSTDLAPV